LRSLQNGLIYLKLAAAKLERFDRMWKLGDATRSSNLQDYLGAGVLFAAIAIVGALQAQTLAVVPISNLQVCGLSQRNTPDKTCIVDGDTLWLNGVNLRLRDVDTPEPRTNICGGRVETELAQKATSRLQELLNSSAWAIETFENEPSGKRLLATIRIDGQDVGDILIAEGLARRWPDGDEFWCP
jgi:endonuclease YncB( thermonuclease family)